MDWRPALAATVALLAAVALGPGAFAKGKTGTIDLREWIRGPVRYIARPEEAKQFRALKTDNDRALFIERFWLRRDPSEATLTNEYRQMFWERVNEANRAFHGSTTPGWKTDRGKIYILYGPPTEIQEDNSLRVDGSIPNPGRGVIRWLYQGRPGGRKDLDAIVVVPFVRDSTGEYRLTSDPRLASVFWDPYSLRERPMGELTDEYLAGSKSRLTVALDLGKMQEVPPQDQVLLEKVETIESYRTHPMDASFLRFRHPDKEATVVIVTLEVQTGRGAEPAIMARFTPRDATRQPVVIGEGTFRIETHGLRRVAQGRVPLDPGTYDVTILSANPYDATTGMFRGTVTVRPPAEDLRLSDVVLASDIQSLQYRALVSYDEPFLIGPFHVVPRLDARVRRGESVNVFFEVYGAAKPYRVSYGLSGRDEQVGWVPLGRPQTTEQEQIANAWGLSTGDDWPLGDYRVAIEVTDEAGHTAGAVVPFTLVAADGGE